MNAPAPARLRRGRQRWQWIALPLVLAAVIGGASVGETDIPISTIFEVLANKMRLTDYDVGRIEEGIVWNYRFSRAVVAACCGAGLALSGVVLQALLRNALADPYLLGISAGASTGAVAVAVAGLGSGVVSLSAGAFAGAVLAFVLVASLARLAGGGTSAHAASVIVLAGIAGSQLFNALTAFVIAQSASAEQVRGITFWLLGNLSGVRLSDTQLAIPAAVLGLLVCLWHVRALDAFTFGTDSAASLGVAVRRVQVILIGVTALVTAVIVAMVGSIGFVGLVIPHAMRLIVGPRHDQLVPASALAGALFLVASDVVSRTLIAGQIIPIGVITALVGAPVFAIILIRRRRTP